MEKINAHEQSSAEGAEPIYLREAVSAYLTLPEKRNFENPDIDLPKALGQFLIDKGFINKLGMWHGSWGFHYEDKKISISDKPMSPEIYNYYIFRLGSNPETNKPLYPTTEDEAKTYRFLHETSHAYQDYLAQKECPEDPESWHTKASQLRLETPFALLFTTCLRNRQKTLNRGLSTWGNVPDYSQDPRTELAARTLDDANELVTMELWNPKYFETYLDYLAGDIPGYGDQNLAKDGLTKISESGKKTLAFLVKEYVKQMKQELST